MLCENTLVLPIHCTFYLTTDSYISKQYLHWKNERCECWKNDLKKFSGSEWDSNPRPFRCRCNAIPTELLKPHESSRVWVRPYMFSGHNTQLKYMNSMVIGVQQYLHCIQKQQYRGIDFLNEERFHLPHLHGLVKMSSLIVFVKKHPPLMLILLSWGLGTGP